MIDIPLQEMQAKIQTTREGGKTLIFDIIRKKYIVLLPEELVRQMLLIYLTEYAHYPSSRIRVEKGVTQQEKKGRYDIIIYDKQVKPWMLIECKSHKVNITQATIDQLSGYNHEIKAPYFMVCNGIHTYCYIAVEEQKKYVLLEELPIFPG